MEPAYVLALDVGERRIGVAVASTIARLPAPLPTLDRTQIADVFSAISQLVIDQNATLVVVGLPRGMEGQETAQTQYCRDFAAELATQVKVPVVMQEETATSLAAEEYLKATGKPYAKGDIDAQSAVIILRDWLSLQVERTA